MHRGEIRLQILRYHMMHHKDGSFFFGQCTSQILRANLTGKEKPVREAQH